MAMEATAPPPGPLDYLTMLALALAAGVLIGLVIR